MSILIDAAARGASEGLQLSLNVGAMLIAFIALVALVNGIFGGIHHALENLQSSPTRGLMLLGETARFCATKLAANSRSILQPHGMADGRELERFDSGR